MWRKPQLWSRWWGVSSFPVSWSHPEQILEVLRSGHKPQSPQERWLTVRHCTLRGKANKCHSGNGGRMSSGWQTPGSPAPCGGKGQGWRWLQCFQHHKDIQIVLRAKMPTHCHDQGLCRDGQKVPRISTCFHQMLRPWQENYIILWMYFIADAAAEKAPEQWRYCSKTLLLASGFTLLPAYVQWVKNGEPAWSHVCLVCSLLLPLSLMPGMVLGECSPGWLDWIHCWCQGGLSGPIKHQPPIDAVETGELRTVGKNCNMEYYESQKVEVSINFSPGFCCFSVIKT